MPIVCQFFGISIIMYWLDHNPPHFHAKYAEYNAIISIDGENLEGYMPKRALQLILAWVKLHKAELIDNWNKASRGEPLKQIEPLE